jgi:hypothetical protein
MEPQEPQPFDPDKIDPGPDAEPIFALTLMLELPFSLRIGEVVFLVSGGGGGWPGWNGHAVGYMAGLAPIPDGLAPTYRIELRQAPVEQTPELLAAERAFPDWGGFDRGQPPRPSKQETGETLRSCALVTVYSPALDTPFAGEDGDETDAEIHEWLSRRFDEALGVLNQYLVILAALNDEWHISSISRIDLPRSTPWRLDLHPSSDDWTPPYSNLDVHATFRDDLPTERPKDEVVAAIDLIHRYRRGEVPFFDWIELYQAAEHHLGSGRNAQSVIAATTAMEVLVNTLFRVLWSVLELDPERLEGALEAPFKNQLVEILPRFLGVEKVGLDDPESDPGRWYRDCYLLRDRIVHAGHKPTSPEAMNAKLATRAFAGWIGASLKPDERTDWIGEFLQAPRRE